MVNTQVETSMAEPEFADLQRKGDVSKALGSRPASGRARCAMLYRAHVGPGTWPDRLIKVGQI